MNRTDDYSYTIGEGFKKAQGGWFSRTNGWSITTWNFYGNLKSYFSNDIVKLNISLFACMF